MGKRVFDFLLSLLALLLLGWFLILIFIIQSVTYRCNGIFSQTRIGRFARPFTIYKFLTIDPKTRKSAAFSKFLRNSKLDELPQLYNILIGDMSFVGPRPDIPGYYDTLVGEDRKILELRPGLTNEASIKYADEEALLAAQPDATAYNDNVIFPDKVRLNLYYYYHKSFLVDLKILFRTVVPRPRTKDQPKF